jgi:hypothetical protein
MSFAVTVSSVSGKMRFSPSPSTRLIPPDYAKPHQRGRRGGNSAKRAALGSSRHGQSADSRTSKSSNKIFPPVFHREPRETVGASATSVASQPDKSRAIIVARQRKGREKVVAYMRTSSATNVRGRTRTARQRVAIEAFAKRSGATIVNWFYDPA